MNTAETIRYFTDIVAKQGVSAAKKALKDAGVDKEIISALVELIDVVHPDFDFD